MKGDRLERDFEIILGLINDFPGKITWYPLARKTKLNIKGVLNQLSEKGYITSFFVDAKNKEKEYFSITDLGEKYLEKFRLID